MDPCSTPKTVATASGTDVRTASELGMTRKTLLLNTRFIESQNTGLQSTIFNFVPHNGQQIGQSIKYCVPHIGQGKGQRMMPETIEPIQEKVERLTYSQDWPAYNEAQSNEKLLFIQLLGELTDQIPKQERIGPGRPRADLGEMIFACCMKIYLNFSSRRTESDLKIVQ